MEANMTMTTGTEADGMDLDQESPSEERFPARRADKIVAVSAATEMTGALMYWELSGLMELSKLRGEWVLRGLADGWLPSNATPEVALSRAVRELQARDVLIRKDQQAKAWVLVKEVKVGEEYRPICRVKVKAEQVTVEPAAGQTQEDADKAAKVVQDEYDRQRANLTTEDVSEWLVKLQVVLQALSLRKGGGVYFIPRGVVDTLHKVKAALAACSNHVIHEIPAMKSDDSVRAIASAMINEAKSVIEEIEAEVGNKEMPLGPKARVTRRGTLDKLAKKLKGYESLLGTTFGGFQEQIDALKKKLDETSTRGEQLEID